MEKSLGFLLAFVSWRFGVQVGIRMTMHDTWRLGIRHVVALMVAIRSLYYGYEYYTEDGVRNEAEYGAQDDNVASDYCTLTCSRLSWIMYTIVTMRYEEFMKLPNPLILLPLVVVWRFLQAAQPLPEGKEAVWGLRMSTNTS